MRGSTPEVQRFLRNVPPALRALVEELRAFVLAVAPETTETVLWKGLSYHKGFEGGRVKGAVCQIAPKVDCVYLEFIHGAYLPDPTGLLVGDAKVKRYVPIRTFDEMPQETTKALIRAAVAYRPGDAA